MRGATREHDTLRGNVASFVAQVARRAAISDEKSLAHHNSDADSDNPTIVRTPTTLTLGAVVGSDNDPYSAPIS
jgi:hypothetical protein